MQQKINEIREAVRHKYAWPGGYPFFLLAADSGCICMKCARKNWRQIARATRYPVYRDDCWRVISAEINWESALDCDNCGAQIESAYGDDPNG